jgi:hypothetical protein
VNGVPKSRIAIVWLVPAAILLTLPMSAGMLHRPSSLQPHARIEKSPRCASEWKFVALACT